ncbi:MAG TPA: hypothetical protein VGB43_02705, partial [Flavobacterium sp.]
RKIYTTAAANESNANELADKLADIKEDGPKTLVAYKGAAITLKSKFSKNIPDKIKLFKEGAKLVESAIAAEPKNVEIRMVRLSIQESVPAIVNYRMNKKEDIAFIINNYSALEGSSKEYIKGFIQRSKSFSQSQKLSVK